jgi:hypothetical protein
MGRSSAAFDVFNQAIALDPDYEVAWIYGRWSTFSRRSFEFLKEGCPRTSKATRLNAAPVSLPTPQKTVAEDLQN